MLLIKGGRVIDPKSGLDKIADVVVHNQRIKQVGQALSHIGYDEIIDARGQIVAPGLVDIHVHFREPGFEYKEDILSGAASAARGGFTSVVCMANTRPVVDNQKTLDTVLAKSKKAPVHVYTCVAISKGFAGEELVDMDGLHAQGAVGFTDDGIPLMNTALLLEAMEKAATLDVPLSLHEEDPALIGVAGVNEGMVSRKLGMKGAPCASESSMVARDLMLAMETGAKVNIQHISCSETVDLVRHAQEKGARVTAEVAPHHFAGTEQLVLQEGALAKVNPPLRTDRDRRAIVQGLKDGTISIIATDHAPHSAEEKSLPFEEAPSGMIGLETALALGITYLVFPRELTLMQLLEKMTCNPADLYGLDAGTLEVGSPADIVLIDPDSQWEITADFASKSSNSPFIGHRVYGRVVRTICHGETVYLREH